MAGRTYYAPTGGLPPQTQLLTDRAVFTEAYAIIPKGTMSDIVASLLPNWEKSRAWIIARPLSGFAETFSQYIMEVLPGGGSDRPEPDAGAEGAMLVVEGQLTITLDGRKHTLAPGGFAFHEMTALIAAAMRGRKLAGFSIVEFQPAADVNDMSAAIVGRLVSHVLGHLARRG